MHILKKSSLSPAHAARREVFIGQNARSLAGSPREKYKKTILGRAIMIIAVYHTNTHAAFAVSAPRTRESCVLRGWKLARVTPWLARGLLPPRKPHWSGWTWCLHTKTGAPLRWFVLSVGCFDWPVLFCVLRDLQVFAQQQGEKRRRSPSQCQRSQEEKPATFSGERIFIFPSLYWSSPSDFATIFPVACLNETTPQSFAEWNRPRVLATSLYWWPISRGYIFA